jgi:type IX secretion system PorP/SprF family membrane protein
MRIYVIIILTTFAFHVNAQVGYQANHYMFNQQLINPASAGKDFKVKAGLLLNSQLTGINSSPKLGALHFSSPIGLTKGSLGFNATSFSLGVQSNTEVTAMYAYRLSFKKSTLVFGMQGTAVNVSSDNNKLTTSSEGDDRFKSPISGFGYNGGIGAYFNTENTYISVSAPAWFKQSSVVNGDLNTELGLSEMPIFLSVGHEKQMSKNWWFNSYILTRMHKNGNNQMDINLMASYQNKIWFGPYYKTGAQYGVMMGAKLNKIVQFSYAGGISQQARAGFLGSSHEVSLLFTIKDKKINTINSLRFF